LQSFALENINKVQEECLAPAVHMYTYNGTRRNELFLYNYVGARVVE